MENITHRELLLANRRRAYFLVAGFAFVVFVLVTLVSLLLVGWFVPIFAPAIGLLAAVIWVTLAWKGARSTVLELSDAEPADEVRHARFFNSAAALSVLTGVAPPELYVVDDPGVNAMATGTKVRDSAVVVTTGLLENLDVVELEAVLALLFQRIKSEEILAETLAVPTVGGTAAWGERLDDSPFLQKILMSPMPAVERLLAWLHPAESEFEVDMASTLITRYPPALASALNKMDGRSALALGTPVTAHLWLAPPVNVALRPSVAALHKPLSERVAVLQEL